MALTRVDQHLKAELLSTQIQLIKSQMLILIILLEMETISNNRNLEVFKNNKILKVTSQILI
jgi:hypothetical protein